MDVVRTADDEGLQQAVDHLVALGHRRIAHIDGGRAPGAAQRRRGYRQAMHRHGLDADIRVVPAVSPRRTAPKRRARSSPAPRPTAVAVFNDRCATGVLDVLRKAGLVVPRDISVVGFDDSRLARLSHVDLTTVAQDAGRMATLAVGRAVERLNGDDRWTGDHHSAAAGRPGHNGPAPKLMLDAVDRAAPSGYTVAKLVGP